MAEARSEGGHILVVDDEAANAELLQAHLESEGYRVSAASDGRQALARAQELLPDLVLLDIMMPGMSGFEVCERLKGQERTAGIPIIMITALTQMDHKVEALRRGADDYLNKPIDRQELLARVRSMLKVRHLSQELDRTLAYLHELEAARHAERRQEIAAASAPAKAQQAPGSRVLVVDDEDFTRQLYLDILGYHGYHGVGANDGLQALETVTAQPVDVILLDIMMPGISGLEALERFRRQAPDVPVIIVTANPSSQNAITALKLGAFDFIVKGFKPDVMIRAVERALERRRLEAENRRLVEELRAKMEELARLTQRR